MTNFVSPRFWALVFAVAIVLRWLPDKPAWRAAVFFGALGAVFTRDPGTGLALLVVALMAHVALKVGSGPRAIVGYTLGFSTVFAVSQHPRITF